MPCALLKHNPLLVFRMLHRLARYTKRLLDATAIKSNEALLCFITFV